MSDEPLPPTSGTAAVVAGSVALLLALGGVAGSRVALVAGESALALGVAAWLLDSERPLSVPVATALAASGGVLAGVAVVLAATDAPPATPLVALLAVTGLVALAVVVAGGGPDTVGRLAALLGCLLAASLPLSALGALLAADSPTTAVRVAAALDRAAPWVLEPTTLAAELLVAVLLARLALGQAVAVGLVPDVGLGGRSLRELLSGTLALAVAGVVLAPSLGVRALAATPTAHLRVLTLVGVALAALALAVLLPAVGRGFVRPVGVGSVAATVAGLWLFVSFGVDPAAVADAAATVPRFVSLGAVLTTGADPFAARLTVGGLSLVGALVPLAVGLVLLRVACLAGVVSGTRGVAGAAAGLLVAAALLSAVVTRAGLPTFLAVGAALLVWDALAFGVGLRELGGGAPAVERGHLGTTAGLVGLGVVVAFGLTVFAGRPAAAPPTAAGAVALLVAGIAAGAYALTE